MKRLIPATVLFLVIIAICTVNSVAVLNLIGDTKADIKKCETLYKSGRFDEARLCAETFKKKWNKTKKTVSVYANHRPLDDISNLAAVLPQAVSERNSYEFYSTAARIHALLDLVYEEQSFTLKSMY